jgi:hypothetical protein
MKKAKTLKRKPCNPKPFLSVVWDTDDRPSQVNVNPNLKWKNINWKRVLKNVFKLQKLIYRASSRGDIRKMRKYQRLLIKSYYPRLLAIRAVTQDNQRRKTVVVDGMKNLPPMQRFDLVELLNILHLKDIPTPELPMPKPSKDEKRSLGIPRMYDRALQALVKLGRSPEWEACFEPNSYGFLPGQSTQDAIEAILFKHFKVMGNKSPYDGDWTYWSTRTDEYPGVKKEVSTLLKQQKNKCASCGVHFGPTDLIEVDHIIPRSKDGNNIYKNQQVLYRNCHDLKTAEDLKVVNHYDSLGPRWNFKDVPMIWGV